MQLYNIWFCFADEFDEHIPVLVSSKSEAEQKLMQLYSDRVFNSEIPIVNVLLYKSKLLCRTSAVKAQLKHRFIPYVKKPWRPLISLVIKEASIQISSVNRYNALFNTIFLTPELNAESVAHEIGHYLFTKLNRHHKQRIEKAVIKMCQCVSDIDALVYYTKRVPRLEYLYSTIIDTYTILYQVRPKINGWLGHNKGYGQGNELITACAEAFSSMCQLIFLGHKIPEELSILHKAVINALKWLNTV